MKTKRTSKVRPSNAYPSMATGMVLPSGSFTSGERRTASFGKTASTSSGVIPKRAARQPAVAPGPASTWAPARLRPREPRSRRAPARGRGVGGSCESSGDSPRPGSGCRPVMEPRLCCPMHGEPIDRPGGPAGSGQSPGIYPTELRGQALRLGPGNIRVRGDVAAGRGGSRPVRHRGDHAVAGAPGYAPGAFEIPLPVEAKTYTLDSLGQGRASVAAEGGVLYTATKTSGHRGEVEVAFTSVKKEPGPRAAGSCTAPTAPGSFRWGPGGVARS